MIRFARPQDHSQLKALWMGVFGDTRAAVDDYFQKRHADANMLVDVRNGEVIGMLSMLPVTLAAGRSASYRARYIYAVATREDYRRQGVSSGLLEAAHQHIQKLNEAACILVPAEPALFRYYEKRGYQTAFSLDILTLRADELPPCPPSAIYSPCSVTDYTHLRDLAFADSSLYARWDVPSVAYAVETFAQPGGVTALTWSGGHGCAAWEKTANGVLVREFALPQGNWQSAIAVLHRALGANEYTVRLAQGSVPGAACQPFGMIHWLIPAKATSGSPPYLSLAMD